MTAYFIRRLLLIPPTLLGITLMVFTITRFVPGGPAERFIMQGQVAGMQSGEGGGGGGDIVNRGRLSPEQIQQIKAYYGFDKPVLVSYFHWLGNILRGDFGRSTRYQRPALDMILERLPISLYYGAVTFIITYGVCIPLALLKAIKHRTPLDNATSVLVFAGYAVPGYVLGTLLVVFPAARWGWFPTNGFVSAEFPYLSFGEQVLDLVQHSVLPLICYLIGSFAFLTLLVKNSLLDQLAADYMRTAAAKGVPFSNAVFRHALRNSLIPVATGLGHFIGIILTGSFLIEMIFNIDGMGLLGYTSLLEQDIPVAMAILLIGSILLLVGNILSDIAVALVDPRVKFT